MARRKAPAKDEPGHYRVFPKGTDMAAIAAQGFVACIAQYPDGGIVQQFNFHQTGGFSHWIYCKEGIAFKDGITPDQLAAAEWAMLGSETGLLYLMTLFHFDVEGGQDRVKPEVFQACVTARLAELSPAVDREQI